MNLGNNSISSIRSKETFLRRVVYWGGVGQIKIKKKIILVWVIYKITYICSILKELWIIIVHSIIFQLKCNPWRGPLTITHAIILHILWPTPKVVVVASIHKLGFTSWPFASMCLILRLWQTNSKSLWKKAKSI